MKGISSAAITVAIPTFNRLALVKRCLESVINQTEKPDEIIVVDNHSTDGTWEYLKSLAGLKIYRNKKNIGSFNNFNKCLDYAKSKYVVILGSDDLLLPNYIKIWKEKISHVKTETAVFFSAGYIIDGNDRVSGIVQPFQKDILLKPDNSLRLLWRNFYFNIFLGGWTIYNRRIFKKTGRITDKYNRGVESEITLKILPNYDVYYTKEVLFAYRIHDNQGFEKTAGDTGSREFTSLSDSFRALLDFEKRLNLAKIFGKKDYEGRLFLRKPFAFLLAQALYCLFCFDYRHAKGYFLLFKQYYPQPYLSLVTFKLLFEWLRKFAQQSTQNYRARLRYKGKDILKIKT